MNINRPTISCVVIAKNEINNIDRWYASVEGLFDEYIFCDTGSTDGTIEKAKNLGLKVVHFEWIHDFAAARNFAFDHATSDYVFWNDLDDTISDKSSFLKWRDNALCLADYWLAPYHYAFDHKNDPVCSFARERCWKRDLGFRWKYFLHEGCPPVGPKGQPNIQYVKTWTINHARTLEDLQKDKGRNLHIFRMNLEKDKNLDPRMHYYYGKELFEAGESAEAATELARASAHKELELHDRVLCLQYTVSAYSKCNQWDKAAAFARLGIELDPQRAEFWVMLGDCYALQKKFEDALPYYSAAKKCTNRNQGPNGFVGLIFTYADAYGSYPSVNLAKCLFHLQRLDDAEVEAKEAFEKYNNQESKVILDEIQKIKSQMVSFKNAKTCDDIVFSCLGGLYEWDSDIALSRGIGGSEQACIHMARELHKLSGKKIKVFNVRQSSKVCHDGVEYLPVQAIVPYLADNKPFFHVAWRHNLKITNAPTFLWSHDLFTPGGENMSHYVKYMCLSEFHKNYVTSLFGIPEDKILVTKNGIDSKKFTIDYSIAKNPMKIVFPNSPDRGLEKVIKICDIVREKFPVELFVFYGFDNMRKMGLGTKADEFESLCKERPWIHHMGNLDHETLLKHYEDAAIWLYPTDFLETSCITAMEIVSKGIYPIVRNWGAIPNTLSSCKDMCQIVDAPCVTELEHQYWATHVEDAIREKKWEKVSVDPKMLDWELVAKEWLEVLPKLGI